MRVFALSATLLLTTGCGIFRGGVEVEETPVQSVRVTMNNASGVSIGEALLRGTPHGVLLTLDLSNAPAGTHALHVHQVGRCERPDFESAGPHFNPDGRQHGILSPEGMHAGDLPNVNVPESGRIRMELLLESIELVRGRNGLFDADGSSLVLHTFADDYRTDPAGNSGSRIACGVIAP